MRIVQIAVAADNDGNDCVYGLSEDGDLYYRAYSKAHFSQSEYHWVPAIGRAVNITPAQCIAGLITHHRLKSVQHMLQFKTYWEKSVQHTMNKVDLIGSGFVVTCTVYAEGWTVSCGDEEIKLPYGGEHVSY